MSVKTAQIKYGELLLNKRILITGGSSGIGLAIAEKCLELNGTVIITGRDEDKLRMVRDRLNSSNLKTIVWDIADVSNLKSLLNQSIDLFGGDFDVLINNAGVLSQTMFPNVSESDWNNVYSINSKGLFFLTQELCKIWSNRKEFSNVKKIINISSQGGLVGATYPYRMTKWDIVGLTQGLGLSMINKNIIINGIAPGIISTDMQKKYLKQGDNVFCDLNPVQRLGFPHEIAELAVFMISDASNFIVAQTIVCDGGFSLK